MPVRQLKHTISPQPGKSCLLVMSDIWNGQFSPSDAWDSVWEDHSVTFAPLPVAGSEEVQILSEWLSSALSESGIKRLTLYCCGDYAPLGVYFALSNPKLCRRLVFVDPKWRAKRSFFERMLSALESRLPLGLPFRRADQGFDPRSSLHRLVLPILILSSADASRFVRSQVALARKRLSSAWFVDSTESYGALASLQGDDLGGTLSDFMRVPAKCPQKGLSRGQ